MSIFARFFLRLFAGLLLLVVVVYAADWAVWRIRVARGGGMDQMEISRVSVTPLKGQKEEYDFEGKDTMLCTRSMLPPLTASGWGTPCWWLARHRQVLTYY